MLSDAKDLAFRSLGSLLLALYGVAAGFMAFVMASWDNKGAGHWYDSKDPVDWLAVAWLGLSAVVTFSSARHCQTGTHDRSRLRTTAVIFIVLNGALPFALSRGDIDALPYFGLPLMIGLVGIWLWSRVYSHEHVRDP